MNLNEFLNQKLTLFKVGGGDGDGGDGDGGCPRQILTDWLLTFRLLIFAIETSSDQTEVHSYIERLCDLPFIDNTSYKLIFYCINIEFSDSIFSCII